MRSVESPFVCVVVLMSLVECLVRCVSFFLTVLRRPSRSRFTPLAYELATMGGRPFLVAGKSRIASDHHLTQPFGGQE